MTKVTFKDALGAIVKTVDQTYDAFNRWIQSTYDSNGAAPGGVSDRFFVYDGYQVVLEFDGSAATDVSHRYLWGPAVDQLFADEQVTSVGSAGSVIWPLADHLGTLRDLATYNAGTDTTTNANHRRYDSFGSIVSESNPTVDLVFSYTGKAFDEHSQLQNNVHRWYDPVTGQWKSEDPIGFQGGDTNLYRNVYNWVLASRDPFGLSIFGEELQQEIDALEDYKQHLKNGLSDIFDTSGSGGFQFGGNDFGIGGNGSGTIGLNQLEGAGDIQAFFRELEARANGSFNNGDVRLNAEFRLNASDLQLLAQYENNNGVESGRGAFEWRHGDLALSGDYATGPKGSSWSINGQTCDLLLSASGDGGNASGRIVYTVNGASGLLNGHATLALDSTAIARISVTTVLDTIYVTITVEYRTVKWTPIIGQNLGWS